MEKQKNNLAIPTAIIIAGALVASAVIYSNGGFRSGSGKIFGNKNNNSAVIKDAIGKEEKGLKPVSVSDHIRGNPNAQVKLVEFSDPECPFCKRFHETMNKIMDGYGKNGKVAWVYRHFPLDSIHSKARKESEALECANEQGGNEKFWSYLDRLMEITPSNDGLDLAQLPKIAEYVGLDSVKFKTCLDSGRHAKKIGDNITDGMNAGAQGTPYSIVISKNGDKTVINGAQPYEKVKAIIEQAIEE